MSSSQLVNQRFSRLSISLIVVLAALAITMLPAIIGLASSETTVTTVSAASFDGTKPVAPESLVAAFGTLLTTGIASEATDADPAVPGIQLPTTLGGTTVEVNGRSAGLLFVSPGQINYLIPRQTESGTAHVKVRSGNGTISEGTVEVRPVAPAVFTASATGSGVPAGSLLRVRANGLQFSEPLLEGNPFPIPIQLGPEGDVVFLIIYLTGIRGAADTDLDQDNNFKETIHIVIDGEVLIPYYAGVQGTFAGLDQINVILPRNLMGRGIVSLGVTATGHEAAKATVLNIGAAAPPARPQVSSFGPTQVLAGQELTITGSGFSSNSAANTVELVDQEGQSTVAPVISASTTELKVLVPFGSGSGRVKVTVNGSQGSLTGMSTNSLSMITSISGFMQDDRRQPIAGVTVRVLLPGDPPIEARTNAEGSFVIANVPPGDLRVLVVDSMTLPAGLTPPREVLRMQPVRANRDNLRVSPIEIVSVFGASSSTTSLAEVPKSSKILQSNGATLDIPANAVVQFPDGTTGGTPTVSVFAAGRTPAILPVGHYSSSIVQITPFGATITPGARLTFPNSDQLPAGSQATLFRFDQTVNSPTVGTFVSAGLATVSTDGLRVVTEATAIKVSSFYFVSILRPTATLLGRVLDGDGRPTRFAIAQARGQATFTDGLGEFALRGVPVMTANAQALNGISLRLVAAAVPSDQVTLDISFLRASGRIDRSQVTNFPIIPGGNNQATSPIALPPPTSNRPPVILAPATLTANAGATTDFTFVASDPDAGQTIQVTVSGAPFATVIAGTKPEYRLRVAPGPNIVGVFALQLTATDNQGVTATRSISLRVNRLPVANAQSVTTNTGVAKAITLTGSDPDGDGLSFVIVTSPAQGALIGTPPNLTYTPAANYGGVDSFTFKVSDGAAESNVATVAITVNSPAPTITSITPSPVTAGASAFTLTVNGTGFVSNSVVRFNGASRVTTFVSATRVTIQIQPSDVASATTASITVLNAAPGGGTSAAATLAINNPTPVAMNLIPSEGTAGGPGFTLTVNGSGFVATSVVRWNGSDKSTTFFNAGQLTAQIPANDIGSPGTATVTVFTPSPVGGSSSGLIFSINNPVPSASSLNPQTGSAGGPGFVLTVNGSGFVPGSGVRWNGASRNTTFINAGQLTAQIPDGDLTSAGSADVTVFSPGPGGGISNQLSFSINNPVPVTISLNPDSTLEGGPGFTLTVNGEGFVPGSQVRWNGGNRSTTFVRRTQLTAVITAADISNNGSANVTVFNPGPGGGTSNGQSFAICPFPTGCAISSKVPENGGAQFSFWAHDVRSRVQHQRDFMRRVRRSLGIVTFFTA